VREIRGKGVSLPSGVKKTGKTVLGLSTTRKASQRAAEVAGRRRAARREEGRAAENRSRKKRKIIG
jgi:hypothetical protein